LAAEQVADEPCVGLERGKIGGGDEELTASEKFGV
jgi:hypothetical protein